MRMLAAALTLSMTSTIACGSDLENLAREGWGAAEVTYAQGEFEGCDFNKRIALDDGLIFVCQTYHYHYAYHPEVLILKNVRGNSGFKIVIDDDEYDGTLFRL